MKDKEWCRQIEVEIADLKNRVTKLDGGSGTASPMKKIIELDIEWPEADIGGLHFNAQKTHGIFERKEDGNYYSRDILIHSARDTDEGTGRDLLSEYLDSEAVREAFQVAAGNHAIRIFLPEKNQGVKKYNGVSWWYWLRPRASGSAAYFCYVHTGGSYHHHASAVGGCAPDSVRCYTVGRLRPKHPTQKEMSSCGFRPANISLDMSRWTLLAWVPDCVRRFHTW